MRTYTSEFMAFAQQGINQSTPYGEDLLRYQLCPTLDHGDLYLALRRVLIFSLKFYGCPSHMFVGRCMNAEVLFNGTRLEDNCNPASGMAQTDSKAHMWNWQRCTEFGWFMVSLAFCVTPDTIAMAVEWRDGRLSKQY
ncbi:MAG: hypothetical protein GY696_15005 [Gammaproteobacteria bacterium]|nr:hypothetical protein [Gammaproteobacteria bacterium]